MDCNNVKAPVMFVEAGEFVSPLTALRANHVLRRSISERALRSSAGQSGERNVRHRRDH